MKITLCVKGYKKILACLRRKLPNDIIEECSPEKTREAAPPKRDFDTCNRTNNTKCFNK